VLSKTLKVEFLKEALPAPTKCTECMFDEGKPDSQQYKRQII